MAHQTNKGKIRDNALKALVRSNLFRHKVERKKKGKGSYHRQTAKKWRDGFENRPVSFGLAEGYFS
ncbi:alternative ribosome-rescue factor A [Eikenella sp. S3360]|uniref:Alternative ribosome-rescue factor A n=1 Tax=Eikenella glucosivorans TaxID=2766967 RepID=A0ABS0NAZ0_9NEIS|nr:alternative ribosome-rescue factor A [Eikenella glucosivorans]MBH5329481.1 alternative ribosome-rescue factor A [Eikenella glucosivorans]